MLCCRNRIWAFSFGCVGFYRCLYPSRSLLFNLYSRLASQLFFKVEWRNSYWLQCVGYSGEASRSEKCRGSKEMLWLCPCVQMPLFNACGFHLVPADCCNCKIDPYVTSQPLPKESSLESLDSRKKYFPAWCCRELFFLWMDQKSDLLILKICLLILGQLREQLSYLKGDNFFRFTCSDCSEDGKEQFERLRLTWQQVSRMFVPGE